MKILENDKPSTLPFPLSSTYYHYFLSLLTTFASAAPPKHCSTNTVPGNTFFRLYSIMEFSGSNWLIYRYTIEPVHVRSYYRYLLIFNEPSGQILNVAAIHPEHMTKICRNSGNFPSS